MVNKFRNKKAVLSIGLSVFLIFIVIICPSKVRSQQAGIRMQNPDFKVGILGAPDETNVEWNDRNMQKMKDLGFNTMQLNIAWGYRPNDEPLNLEDVISIPKQFQLPIDIDSAKTLRSSQKIEERGAKIKHRIALCKKYGFRTIFHFGAPFVGYPPVEPLSQCISDPNTVKRYVTLIQDFHKKFPGVNDLLCYTYDQNAWLCSEFGPCPRCHGVPLHERVSKFVNILAQTWKRLEPNGIFWWEPWELSAGEVYKTIDLLDSSCVGLSIHSNIAEVQIAFPVDRWFKNVVNKAADKKIPVMGELFMGCPTEEMEPYKHIAAPLATLRALRAINEAGKIKGIKEYYGNVPDQEDPNLKMTAIFFHDPNIGDKEALMKLALPYKGVEEDIQNFWKLSSAAVELYPWDVSWFAREVGKSNPDHPLTAATLKAPRIETPSWQSSRKSAFMVTDKNQQPNFWMIEDIQLRFEQAELKIQKALEIGAAIKNKIPIEFRSEFNENMAELTGLRKRVLAYVYHLRETNLANLLRSSKENKLPVNQNNVEELKLLLIKDQENQNSKEPLAIAIKLLDEDLDKFLNTYFLVPDSRKNKVKVWSITSQ
jgi:hypothetical protein